MLDVDNTKWEQELDEFGVEGIPPFAFLDQDGNEDGNVVGRLPKQYLLENVDALHAGKHQYHMLAWWDSIRTLNQGRCIRWLIQEVMVRRLS